MVSREQGLLPFRSECSLRMKGQAMAHTQDRSDGIAPPRVRVTRFHLRCEALLALAAHRPQAKALWP